MGLCCRSGRSPARAADQAGMLVEPAISRAKLDRELEDWEARSDAYRRHGLILLRRRDLEVDVGFACPFELAPGQQTLGLIAIAIRLRFDDYDLKPPSVRFINSFTGKPEPPSIDALEDKRDGRGAIRILPLDARTGEHFFCAPGNREFHDFPQHKGELWPVYRSTGAGRLDTICERLRRATVGTIRGWQLTQTMARPPLGPGATVGLLQLTDRTMQEVEKQAQAQLAAAKAPAAPRNARR